MQLPVGQPQPEFSNRSQTAVSAAVCLGLKRRSADLTRLLGLGLGLDSELHYFSIFTENKKN